MSLSDRFPRRGCVALLLALPLACPAQDELFVSNSNSNAITLYARTASGNTAPIRVLQGAATALSSPSGIAVDLVNDELIVANKTAPYSVTIYPRTASGNTAPLRTIIGNLTTLDDPRGVAVDPLHGEFSVANRAGFSVTTWARTANGNVAPLRALRTPMAFSNPWGVLVDVVHDEIAVANNGQFHLRVPAPRRRHGAAIAHLLGIEHRLQRRTGRHRARNIPPSGPVTPKCRRNIPPCGPVTPKRCHNILHLQAAQSASHRLKVCSSPGLRFSLSPHLPVWPKPTPRGSLRAVPCSKHEKWRERLHGESAAG